MAAGHEEGGQIVTIELPARLGGKVTAAARRRGVRPEQFVRQAVERELTQQATKPNGTLYDLSRDLCGSLKGGPRDLARN